MEAHGVRTRARARARGGREGGGGGGIARRRVRHLEVIVAQAAEGAVHVMKQTAPKARRGRRSGEADRQADVLVEHVPLVLRLLRRVAADAPHRPRTVSDAA